MARYETRHSQFGLISGIHQPSSDMALVVEAAGLFAPEARKGHLYIVAEADHDGGRSRDACQTVIRTIRKLFYEDSSFSVTSSLRKAIIAANRILYQQNFSTHPQKRGSVGITCAVVKGDDLYIAQVAPSQAYLLNDGNLRALPPSMAWNPAHSGTTSAFRLNALGTSLTVDPEFYRAVLRPGDALLLSSSNLARLLGRDETLRLLRASDPDDVINGLLSLCKNNALQEAHALALGIYAPLSPAAQASPLSRAGIFERGVMAIRALGDAAVRTTGEATLLIKGPAERLRRKHAATRSERAQKEGELLATMPEEPGFSPNPPSLPRPLQLGETIEERLKPQNDEQRTRLGGLSPRPIDSGRLPPSALLGEASYSAAPAQEVRIDLSDTLGRGTISSQRDPNGRPPIDPTLSERLQQPFGAVGGLIERMTRRRRMQRPPPRAVPQARRQQGLSYRRQGPSFPWVWLLLLVSLVAVLFLYGVNLSNQNARREVDTTMTTAEQAVAAIYQAPDEATAQARLDDAANALAAVRATTLVTATIDSRQRYEALQREYDRAFTAIHKITYFEDIDEVATNPLPGGLFDSVVVPPPPRGITDTIAFGSIYILDANAGILYSVPKTGGTIRPILRPEDTVDGLNVGRIRSMDWRFDTIVAVTQSGEGGAYNYFFRSGEAWRYSILAGSEEWGGASEHFRAVNYEGNLYVWGAAPGNVLRYLSGAYGDFPDPWIQNDGGKNVDSSIDLAVEGKVYLLQPDGRVLVFASNDAGERVFEREVALPAIKPPLDAVARFAVTGDPESGWIFLVDAFNLRIIQLDKTTGAFIQQIRAAPDAEVQLDNLTNVFVDTTTARPTLYLVNGSQILRAALPDPPPPFRDVVGTPAPATLGTPLPTVTPEP